MILDSGFLIPDLLIYNLPISLSPHLPIDFFFPSVPRHLPDEALVSELAVELWIDAVTAMVNIEALTALLTESHFMFLTDPNCLPVRMISTLHLAFSSVSS